MTPLQTERLHRLLTTILPANRFYAAKFAGSDTSDFANLPFTTKDELAADQLRHPPYGTNLTFPAAKYTRLHQTSGTSTGRPLKWLDTPDSWDWLLGCWKKTFPLMGLTGDDVLVFPFSFGPFLGFWTAFEAATATGYRCLAAGGMTTTARLRYLLEHRATVVFATPTYALHLADVAAAEGIDLPNSPVRAVVVAGEPGGGIPATRDRIAAGWGARVFDHYGMTEVGPVAVEQASAPGTMCVLDEYLAEVLDPGAATPTWDGSIGELVLTNLGRIGSPVIRYRTGDLVQVQSRNPIILAGGVRGRADDMIHIRGNNLYPAAVEAVVRRFPEVVEFRIVVDQSGPLADLRIEVEPSPAAVADSLADAVSRAIRDEFLFRVDVRPVPCHSLPRFEMKARRVVRIP